MRRTLIEKPAVTVITPVSIDHQQFLGETLAEIAGEKAAIQKRGVPSVIGPQPPEAAAAIDAYAARTGAPTFRFGRSFSVETTPGGMVYSAGGRLMLPRPVLPGAHQIDNAATAIAALERLKGFTITEMDLANGLMKAEWPARMQRLKTGPLVDLLPGGWELWLDGGHNAAAGEAIAAHAAEYWTDRPLWLVAGLLNNKQADRFLAAFEGVAEGARTVTIPGEPASFTAQETAAIAHQRGPAGRGGEGRGVRHRRHQEPGNRPRPHPDLRLALPGRPRAF